MNCGKTHLVDRRVRTPRFRCSDCGAEFPSPVPDEIQVTRYSAVYEGLWLPFESPAPVRALETTYRVRDRQNAIRPLDWVRALDLLRFYSSGVEEHLQLELVVRSATVPGGFFEAAAKRRIGQEKFRDMLFDWYGNTCAVTGTQPKEVLDAAHLQAYADHPVHESKGGLLLRADVHRLFDRMLLTFDPTTWHTRVAPPLLARHEQMLELDDVPITVPEHLRPSPELIALHHDSAKARWRDLARA